MICSFIISAVSGHFTLLAIKQHEKIRMFFFTSLRHTLCECYKCMYEHRDCLYIFVCQEHVGSSVLERCLYVRFVYTYIYIYMSVSIIHSVENSIMLCTCTTRKPMGSKKAEFQEYNSFTALKVFP